MRTQHQKLTLAVVGPSRCGKDTVCEWLRDHTILRYEGGCSWTGRHYVADRLGVPVEEAWATRHARKMEWYHLLNEYRATDPARLVKDCLKHSEIVAGVRDGREMMAALGEGLFDLVIWVDRDVPPDPTLTFGPELADVVLPNRDTKYELFARIERLARALGISRC